MIWKKKTRWYRLGWSKWLAELVFILAGYVITVHIWCVEGIANYAFHGSQGSDPRVATCRGKLQNKRSKLNQEINKELRLRAGAENLFK